MGRVAPLFEKFCVCFISLAWMLALPRAGYAAADEISQANVDEFRAVDKKVEAQLVGDLKERYKTSQEAFMNYFKAEKENLGIFSGPFETKRHGVVYIYRDTMNNMLKNRTEELASFLAKDGKWLSKTVRGDLMRDFAAVNQRVPYDRGEGLRSSFRAVERAWEAYIDAEKAFYSLYCRDDKQAGERCICVLYEQRTEDLYLEHKGVTSLKREKEE